MANDNPFFTHKGHLSESAVTAVADGQEHLLPTDIVSHIDDCEHCAARVGEAALTSAQVAEALEGLAQISPSKAHHEVRPPVWAVVSVSMVAIGSLGFRAASVLQTNPVESASMLFDAASAYASLPAPSSVIQALQYAAPLVFFCTAVAAGTFASRKLARSAS